MREKFSSYACTELPFVFYVSFYLKRHQKDSAHWFIIPRQGAADKHKSCNILSYAYVWCIFYRKNKIHHTH